MGIFLWHEEGKKKEKFSFFSNDNNLLSKFAPSSHKDGQFFHKKKVNSSMKIAKLFFQMNERNKCGEIKFRSVKIHNEHCPEKKHNFPYFNLLKPKILNIPFFSHYLAQKIWENHFFPFYFFCHTFPFLGEISHDLENFPQFSTPDLVWQMVNFIHKNV